MIPIVGHFVAKVGGRCLCPANPSLYELVLFLEVLSGCAL